MPDPMTTPIDELAGIVEPVTVLGPDWTYDPETGRTNSSAEYLALVTEVARLIQSEFHVLDSRAVDMAAGLIMAQLAHVHGLRPRKFIDAARSTPVPASNDPTALIEATAIIEDIALLTHEHDDSQPLLDDLPVELGDRIAAFLNSGVPERSAVPASNVSEGLPSERDDKWFNKGYWLGRKDEIIVTWESAGGERTAAHVTTANPSQPDATEEAKRAAANPDDPSHESAIRYLSDPDWDATEEAGR